MELVTFSRPAVSTLAEVGPMLAETRALVRQADNRVNLDLLKARLVRTV